ncbi:MAG: hypothetical protein ACK4NM_18965, partial [Hydrogenophaga sp.]
MRAGRSAADLLCPEDGVRLLPVLLRTLLTLRLPAPRLALPPPLLLLHELAAAPRLALLPLSNELALALQLELALLALLLALSPQLLRLPA